MSEPLPEPPPNAPIPDEAGAPEAAVPAAAAPEAVAEAAVIVPAVAEAAAIDPAASEAGAIDPAASVSPALVAPRAKLRPWVTYALVAANVAIWILTLTLGASAGSPSPQWLFDHGGNLGAVTLDGEEWRLFTSMFLHAGALHVGMNVLGLVGSGRLAERWFGRLGFAAIYLISGLAGSLATALRPGVVSVGASGAIFGVLGAVGAYYALHRERMDPATAKEASGLLVFIAYNFVFGLSMSGIDMYAHLGGLVAGFACGLALELGRRGPAGRRPLAVGAIGLAAVIAAAFVVPAPVDPMQEERKAFTAFAAIETKVQARWSELIGQAQRQAITDEGLADAIEQELLPPWRAGREAFERSGAGGPRRALVLDYLRDMQEGWEIMSSGLRAHDGDAVDRGGKRLQDATRKAEQSLRE